MFNVKDYTSACVQAKTHAMEEWPKECCGIILNNGEYIRLQNVAKDPTQHFDCHDERLPYMLTGNVVAMVHSHPYEPRVGIRGEPMSFGPSKHDMIQQMADGIPWGLIACDGLNVTWPFFWGDDIPSVPLENRGFRHGPSGTDGKGDCYALIKDYYSQVLNIELPEGPRDNEWWIHNENLYVDNMKRAGFTTIPAQEARPGDVFFAQINSDVANHGGILLDGGLILHQLWGRVSRKEPLVRWRRQIVKWIRHKDLADGS